MLSINIATVHIQPNVVELVMLNLHRKYQRNQELAQTNMANKCQDQVRKSGFKTYIG